MTEAMRGGGAAPMPQVLPAPTRDREQALADLRTFGLCLIVDALDPAALSRAREAICRAAADDRARGREVKGFGLDQNPHNQRVWHRTGTNTTRDKTRAAVFPFYTRTIYRTQENWFLSLDPAVRRYASDTLLTLLAYRSEGFGLVYGESPVRGTETPSDPRGPS